MLQQTQVDRVKDYYTRFLDTFPTVRHLAAATEQAVLQTWDGLGYYNRARNLHKTAIIIVDEYDGQFPETIDELVALPGVGRYTAGAIASFAFVQPSPIVDTNVKRVLERVFVQRRHSSPAKQERRIWNLAGDLITPKIVWAFNQALMDFGAKICRAQRPKCGICPLRSFCIEYERRRSPQMEIPYAEADPQFTKAAEPYVPYARNQDASAE